MRGRPNCACGNLPPVPFPMQVAANMTPAQFLSTWTDFSRQVAAALSTNASEEALARLVSERVRGQGLPMFCSVSWVVHVLFLTHTGLSA